ncbi:hypothetical protein [Escherichia coli]|uniref:hypothetical protein n=1 Tax=Escherichia coli TaxID=562 RepID=UPI0012FFC6C9|nr:hypothetical protein [Escherichia coli]
MNKQNGISIIEVCLVLISALFFIYITAYVLHLAKTFNEARNVANDLRLMKEQIEIHNNPQEKRGYKIYKNQGYYLIIREGEKKIDEIFMICTLVKDSCGYVSNNNMKYISFLRTDVSLADINFQLPNSNTVNVALLFRI